MKVFHVGITAPSYSSESITKSFKDVFGDCLFFDWQLHRFSYGTETMRSNLLLEAKTYQPDVIFLHLNHNSEALSIVNYEELSKIAFTITYTEDVRENIDWFKTITPIVGLSIFTNIDDVETLKSKGVNNAMYLPVSYNDIWYKKQPKTERYYGDIVFLGNNYVGTNLNFPKAQERQDMIAALKKEFGDKFQAYGLGQENKMLNPQEAIECYNNAKIAIGHNNFTRKGYQSDRCLNSMGCGCLTIMQHYEGIGYVDYGFPLRVVIAGEIMQERDVWDSFEKLISMCKRYLLNDNIREMLAEKQHNKVTENHTWKQRAESIKSIIENK